MSRKILLLVSIWSLASTPIFIVGCSSSDEQTQTDQAASEDGLDDGDLAEGEDAANPESATDVAGTPAEATPSDTATDGGDDIVADLGDDPTAEGDASTPAALPDQAMGSEPADQPVADAPPPEDPGMDTSAVPPPLTDDAPPAPKVSLKKAKDAPFNSNGRILNTIYVARKGDNLNKVGEKLLGDKKRKKELIADNSFLSRGVKEGDKIYYNSPRRPDDTTTMMTYYEDNGITAQNYVAKEGDNLRDVAKELIGSKEGWKELWSLNPTLESKGALDAGTEIRYWPKGEDAKVAATPPPPAPSEMAQAELPSEPPVAMGGVQPPPPQTDLNNLPPPSDSLPPPPPAPSDLGAMPPPPPPAEQMAEFPPAPPPMNMAGGEKKPTLPESLLFQDQETTMALGAGAIILLSVIMIIVHRIKKGRAQRMRLGQTQI